MKKVLVYGLKNMRGGLERYLISLHEQIHEDVSLHYLVEQCDCMYRTQIEAWGGKIVYLPERHPLGDHLRELNRVLGELRREIDTLYVNVNGISFDIAVILLGRFHGYRVVVHSHNAMMEPIKHPVYRTIHKTLEFVALTILRMLKVTRLAVSEKASQYLFGNKKSILATPGIVVGEYAFNETQRKVIREQLGVQEQLLVGFVGRLTEIKQPDMVLRIFREIRKRSEHENAHLVMLGNGPMYDELVQDAAACGLEKAVTFMGEVTNPSDYYKAMDYLLLPSQSEGLSLVAIEAQASGLPIACSAGRFPEVIHITELVNFIPLEEDAACWADACLAHLEKVGPTDRKTWNEIVGASPFELRKAALAVKDILLGNV